MFSCEKAWLAFKSLNEHRDVNKHRDGVRNYTFWLSS